MAALKGKQREVIEERHEGIDLASRAEGDAGEET